MPGGIAQMCVQGTGCGTPAGSSSRAAGVVGFALLRRCVWSRRCTAALKASPSAFKRRRSRCASTEYLPCFHRARRLRARPSRRPRSRAQAAMEPAPAVPHRRATARLAGPLAAGPTPRDLGEVAGLIAVPQPAPPPHQRVAAVRRLPSVLECHILLHLGRRLGHRRRRGQRVSRPSLLPLHGTHRVICSFDPHTDPLTVGHRAKALDTIGQNDSGSRPVSSGRVHGIFACW